MKPPPPDAAAGTAGSLPFKARARTKTRAEATTAVKNVPVKVWAGFGALIFAFQAYVIIKWVTGPYFTPVDIGNSEIPHWMEISLRVQEVVFGVVLAYVVWHFIDQPFRRRAAVSTDGLLSLLASSSSPGSRTRSPTTAARSSPTTRSLLDMGSWVNEVPGAVTQGQSRARRSARASGTR